MKLMSLDFHVRHELLCTKSGNQNSLNKKVVSLCFLQMERRFQSQLQNMKERLEQSDSTNRSLQNYVHFLKTSYGNVFGDSLLAS